MIYRLRFDRERFLVFNVPIQEIEAKLGDPFILKRTPVESWEEIWQPLDAQFSDDSDKQNVIRPPDITVWFTDNLVLSERAFKLLEKELTSYGELLPVNCEGVKYWVLHVTKVVGEDAIDLAKSKRFVDESTFINLESLVFKEQRVGDLLVFRTEFTGYRNIFCTEKFKHLLEASGLRGLIFSDDLVQSFAP